VTQNLLDMRNSTIAILLLFQLFNFGCDAPKTVNSTERPPNIIIMLADDQGWGDLSHSGNTDISTPNIDALAANGASFNRFYVNPVCSPTRAEFLTGRYHTRGGVYSTSAGGERLDLDETTIAEVFKQAGYQTAAYGKWHNGMQGPYHPNARGFDEFYGFCSGHWGNYFSPMLEHNGVITKGEGFLVDDLTNQAMDFITQHREEPFFVYLPYNTPHSPMQVPERFWEKFADKSLSLHSQDTSKENELHMKAALAMCENIDWNVGRLMEKLDELELTNETIVIYFSDNGPNGWRWNGGMKGRKGSTDEGGIRSPFFIQWRGTIPAEMNISPIAAGIDILPTLADLADIEVETRKPLDGISLAPLLLKDPPAWSDRMIFSHWKGNVSVRNQAYRLDKDDQLFDMIKDPGQTQDVSESHAEVAAAMIDAKREWMKEVMAELKPEEKRPFLIGHPDFEWTQIPARDGIAHGNIKRSNRWPNCSFFTNWVAPEDKISWEVEVMEEGDFEVIIYYTCPAEDVGSDFELSFRDATVSGTIAEAHDPPLAGMEHDYVERQESYVKAFKPLSIGQIHLSRGSGELMLKATNILGKQVMDFRLMMLRRAEAGGGS